MNRGLLISVLVMLVSNLLSTPTALDTNVRVVPRVPLESDSIQITAFGNWTDTCIPEYVAHHVQGNLIRIETQTPPQPIACLQIITPWEVTINLDPLPKGVYTVSIYIDGGLAAQVSFLVASDRLYLPFVQAPIIPTM